MIYAIIRSGGKQYRVEPDQVIAVEKLPAEVGSTVEITDVLMVADNGDVLVGQPLLDGARVIAEVVEHGRHKKVVVFKYKAKTRYRRTRGHRQAYTRLAIRRILTGAEPAKPPAKAKPKRRRAAKAKEEVTEAEARPRRRARAKKAKPAPEHAETPGKATAEASEERKPKRAGRKKAESE